MFSIHYIIKSFFVPLLSEIRNVLQVFEDVNKCFLDFLQGRDVAAFQMKVTFSEPGV